MKKILFFICILLALNVQGQGNFFGSHTASETACDGITVSRVNFVASAAGLLFTSQPITAGSLVVVHIFTANTDVATTPSGWTSVSPLTGTSTSTYLYYKYVSASSTPEVFFDFGPSGTSNKAGSMFVITGVSSLSLVGNFTTTTTTYNSRTTPSGISVNPCTGVVASIMLLSNQTITNNTGTGWTGISSDTQTNSGGYTFTRAIQYYNAIDGNPSIPTTTFSWPTNSHFGWYYFKVF